jgi:hypothetical protein
MNRGVVSACPKGTYREGIASPLAQLNCTRCSHGFTTVGVAATSYLHCNRTLPGYYSLVGNQGVSGATALPCPVGTWAGERAAGSGSCFDCGSGWTTRNNTVDSDGYLIGANSQSACGKYVSALGKDCNITRGPAPLLFLQMLRVRCCFYASSEIGVKVLCLASSKIGFRD